MELLLPGLPGTMPNSREFIHGKLSADKEMLLPALSAVVATNLLCRFWRHFSHLCGCACAHKAVAKGMARAAMVVQVFHQIQHSPCGILLKPSRTMSCQSVSLLLSLHMHKMYCDSKIYKKCLLEQYTVTCTYERENVLL